MTIVVIAFAAVALTRITEALWGRTGQIVLILCAIAVVILTWLVSILAARFEKRSQAFLRSVNAEYLEMLVEELDDVKTEQLLDVLSELDEYEEEEVFSALSSLKEGEKRDYIDALYEEQRRKKQKANQES